MTANAAAPDPSSDLPRGRAQHTVPVRRRRVPIRLKLAAAMCIPTVALTLFVAGEVTALSGEVAQVRRQTSLATSTHGPTQVVIALQTERNWAVVELLGQSDTINVGARGYPDTRRSTDEAVADFREALARGEDEAVAAYEPAIDGLAALPDLRQKIGNFVEPRGIDNVPFANDIFLRYSLLIAPFMEGTRQVADVVDHPGLRHAASLIDNSVRQMETVAQMGRQTIVYGVLSRGGVDQTFEIAELGVLLDQYRTAAATLDAGTQGEYRRPVDDWMFRDWTAELGGYVDTAIHTRVLDLGAFLEALTVPEDRTYVAYEDHVADVLEAKADDLTAAAARRQLLYVVAVVLVGVVAVAGMVVVGQLIVRSLKSLTRQATDMAHHRLPSAVATVLGTPPGDDVAVPPVEPMALETRDEVGDVASALNTLQDAAIDLAVGQAVLRRNIADSFVNLGRRNQNLLSRQIAFITELEHREPDPDNLSNLFRLDHLATRMRRNAESLLVLGGVPTTRSQSGPMRMSDIVRATLSEVEDYQRVVVRTLQPALVIGSTGADLIHLLAELVDNALMFSHRDRTAEIQGVVRPDGYTLTITDQGKGMRSDDMARANRRLAGTEQFTVAPSRYLGHYVAGHLAARHGIQVRLQEGPGGGIAATVHLPHTTLTGVATPAPPMTPAPPAPANPTSGRDDGIAPVSGVWLQQPPATRPGPGGPIIHSPSGAEGTATPLAPHHEGTVPGRPPR